MCIKVPKKQTQRSPKNRTNLYELYVHGKSDQDIEVPYGPMRRVNKARVGQHYKDVDAAK